MVADCPLTRLSTGHGLELVAKSLVNARMHDRMAGWSNEATPIRLRS